MVKQSVFFILVIGLGFVNAQGAKLKVQSSRLGSESSDTLRSEFPVWSSEDQQSLDTVRVTIPNRAAPPGAFFIVPIVIPDDATPYHILSAEFTLTFDAGLLSFRTVSPGELIPPSYKFEFGYSGNRVFVATAGTDTLTGDGPIALIEFKVWPKALNGQTGIFHFQRFQFNEPPGVGPIAKTEDGLFVVGGYPALELSATEHDFGEVSVGDSSSWTLTIANSGWMDLLVEDIKGSNSEFGVANLLTPFTVEAGSSVDVVTYFAPAHPGVREGTVVVQSNDYFGNESVVSMRGTGIAPDIALSAREYFFGQVPLGYSSGWTLEIWNQGNAPLVVNSALTYPSVFSVVWPPFPHTVAVGETSGVILHFIPQELGQAAGVLSLYSNDPDENPADVFLSGVGIEPQADIFISADNQDFGGIYIGAETEWTVSISNVGTAPLTIDSIVSDRAEFDVRVPSCPQVLDPAVRVDMTVTFKPTVIEPVGGTITVFSDDPDESMVVITVTGYGLAPAVLTVLSAGGSPGSVANVVAVDLSNTEEISFIEFVLSFGDDLLSPAAAIPTERSAHMENFQVDLNYGDDRLRMTVSDQFRTIPAGSGEVAKFAFNVSEDASDGEYPLALSEVRSFDAQGRQVSFIVHNGSFTIHSVGLEDGHHSWDSPITYGLFQNYPNPFNPSTRIRFSVANEPSFATVQLTVYNLLGQRVRTLVDGPRETGYYTVTWDGRDDLGRSIAAGVYIYRLQVGTYIQTRQMVLMK